METISVIINFTRLVDIKKVASGDTINIPEGTDISGLLSILGIIEQHKKYIIVMISGRKENLSYKLKNGDEVNLFLPVGGG
jgi:molybdopterin converting factor small subunit